MLPLMSASVRSYKMDKITIIEDEFGIEIVIIDKGNDEWVTMAKSTYDEMIAQQTGGN
jgi:hypothetical protein